MALDFPNTPTDGDQWTDPSNNVVYEYSAATNSWFVVGGVDLYGQATETSLGVAELATVAEVQAGTDDLRIVTPMKAKSLPYIGLLPVLP